MATEDASSSTRGRLAGGRRKANNDDVSLGGRAHLLLNGRQAINTLTSTPATLLLADLTDDAVLHRLRGAVTILLTEEAHRIKKRGDTDCSKARVFSFSICLTEWESNAEKTRRLARASRRATSSKAVKHGGAETSVASVV